MNKLIDEFRQVREQFISIVDKFPTDRREEILFDQWNLKQVLINMARWDNCLADNLVFLKEGQQPPFYGKVNDFNQKSQEIGRSWSWDKAYNEFISGGKRLIKEHEFLPENLWEAKFWPDKNSTPTKFFQIVIKHYLHDHLPLVKRWLIVRPRK